MITKLKVNGKLAIKYWHITMAINFFSSKDSEEIRTLHSKSDNIKILIGNETGETIEDLFDSFLQRY